MPSRIIVKIRMLMQWRTHMNVKDSWIEVYSDITDQGKRNDIEDYPHRVKCRRFNQESYDGGIVSCERGLGLLSSNMN